LINIELKYASVIIKYPQSFLNLLFSDYNPISFISSIEPLNGGNYGSWREKLEMALALSEIDLALTSHCPTKPVDLVRGENETDAAWTTRTREHAPIIMKYDLDKAKWDQSNRKCLMVIKSSIVEAIRGAIPEGTTAIEYLRKVESQFTSSSKAYASTLINRLVTREIHRWRDKRAHTEDEQHGI
jgi:hypothetical protein